MRWDSLPARGKLGTHVTQENGVPIDGQYA